MAVLTSTDRHKSVRNRCVIDVFGGVFVLSRCFFYFSVDVGLFVIGLTQMFRHFLDIIFHLFKLLCLAKDH